MAAISLENQKSRPRVDSFQRMLDLEKRYKLARLHRAQTPPTSDSTTSVQLQIQTPSIQARRRNLRDYPLPNIESTSDSRLAPGGGSSLPLSITVSPPQEKDPERRQKQQRVRSESGPVAAKKKGPLSKSKEEDEARPRGRSVEFASQCISDTAEGEGNMEGSQSDQSSICQSPSWEGYGKKKRNKRMEAELRKRDKDTADRTPKLGVKRKTTNRLYKLPPHDFQDPTSSRDQSSTSPTCLQEKASELDTTELTNELTVPRITIPDRREMAKGSVTVGEQITIAELKTDMGSRPLGSSAQRNQMHPVGANTKSASAEGLFAEKARNGVQSTVRPDGTLPSFITLAPAATANDKTSYPPTSSKSHNLSGFLTRGHSRRNSVSTSFSSQIEEASKIFRARDSESPCESGVDSAEKRPDQALHSLFDRGRLPGGTTNSGSYVRQVRTQSIERSIGGVLEQTALSAATGRSSLDSHFPEHHEAETWRARQRITLSQTKWPIIKKPMNTENYSKELAANPELAAPQKLQGCLQRHEQQGPQTNNTQPVQQPEPSGKKEHSKVERETGKRFTLASKPYTSPSLDSATPTSGIFSSIRSRMSRRGSSSSGANSVAARSFREMAINAIHFPVSSVTTLSQSGSDEPGKSQSTSPSQTMAGGDTALASTKEVQILHPVSHDSNGPNAKSASSQTAHAINRPFEVSSTSSFHDDTSTSPSPPSTPDTSRPQSARGLPATIEDAQILEMGEKTLFGKRDPEILESKRKDLLPDSLKTLFSRPLDGADEPDARKSISRPNETDGKIVARPEECDANRSRPNCNQPQKMKGFEQPASGKILGDHKHIFQDVIEPTRRVEDRPEDTRCRTTSSGDRSLSFADGLGLLDKSWSHKPITPDTDTLSFVTTLTNQEGQYGGMSEDRNAGTDVAASLEAISAAEDSRRMSSQARGTIQGAFKAVAHEAKENTAPTTIYADSGFQYQKKSQLQPRNAYDKQEMRGNQHTKHTLTAREDGFRREQVKGQAKKEKNLEQSHIQANKTLPKTTSTAGFVSPVMSSSGRNSPSAVYLQGAGRSAPVISSPLSNVIRSATANMSSSSLPTRTKANLKTLTSLLPPSPSDTISPKALQSSPLHNPARDGKLARPIAKMLVECCHCKFLHDMPSRVYECMAQPDAVVTDQSLGVSGAITTMVKCPWCHHNMSKKCCAGYAAMVYLKERLH